MKLWMVGLLMAVTVFAEDKIAEANKFVERANNCVHVDVTH